MKVFASFIYNETGKGTTFGDIVIDGTPLIEESSDVDALADRIKESLEEKGFSLSRVSIVNIIRLPI